MNDQFRANEDNGVIRDKQIGVAVRWIVLTQFAMVDAAEHHRLPGIIQQFLEFEEGLLVSRLRWEWLIAGEPSHSEKRVSMLLAEVVAFA